MRRIGGQSGRNDSLVGRFNANRGGFIDWSSEADSTGPVRTRRSARNAPVPVADKPALSRTSAVPVPQRPSEDAPTWQELEFVDCLSDDDELVGRNEAIPTVRHSLSCASEQSADETIDSTRVAATTDCRGVGRNQDQVGPINGNTGSAEQSMSDDFSCAPTISSASERGLDWWLDVDGDVNRARNDTLPFTSPNRVSRQRSYADVARSAANRPGQSQPRPAARILQIQRTTHKVVCLFTPQYVLVNDTWSFVKSMPEGRWAARQILKIERAQSRQSNETCRYDMYLRKDTTEGTAVRLMRSLEKATESNRRTRQERWRVEQKIYGSEASARAQKARQRRREVERVANEQSNQVRPLRMMTLNVNGLGSAEKRTGLQEVLYTKRVDVACVQETRRDASATTLYTPGFATFEIPADGATKCGLAILTRRDRVRADRIGRDLPGMLFVKLTNLKTSSTLGANGLIVGCFYRANNVGRIKDLVTEVQRLAGKFPLTNVVVMGDFNRPKPQLVRKLRACTTATQRLIHVEDITGNDKTFHRMRHGRFVMSAIDHVVSFNVAGRPTRDVHQAAVDRQVDLSDHWPIVVQLREPTNDGRNAERRHIEEMEGAVIDIGRVQMDDGGWKMVRATKSFRYARQRMNRSSEWAEHRGVIDAANSGQVAAALASADLRNRNEWQSKKVSMKRNVIEEKKWGIATAPQWKAVQALVDDAQSNMDTVAAAFTATSHQVARKHGVVEDVAQDRKGKIIAIRPSRRVLQAAKKRRVLYAKLLDAAHRQELNARREESQMDSETEVMSERALALQSAVCTAKTRYFLARTTSARIARIESKDRFLKKRIRGAKMFAGKRWREYWRWLRTLLNNNVVTGKTMQANMPVRNPDDTNQLLTEPSAIAKAYALHYGRLAADVTGHSRVSRYWKEQRRTPEARELDRLFNARWRRQHEGEMRDMIRPREMTTAFSALDQPITWEEVKAALVKSKNGKASGADDVPAEWLKAAAVDTPRRPGPDWRRGPGHEDRANPYVSPMARTLTKLLNRVFITGDIPIDWTVATVVSIPKANVDDPLDANEQRGISIMSVVLKLLCKIVAARLSAFVDRSGLLIPEQCGFRDREEAVGQALTLVEVCERRRITGQPTYIVFVDLKKAYDTVPHAAMISKLRHHCCIEKSSTLLQFINKLYGFSRLAIFDASDNSELRIPLERGLRQGCPISPCLFNIYINDILNESDEWAISVPRVPAPANRLGGLLFADDLALLAGSVADARRACDSVSDWCKRNEMSVGIKKCGIMVVDGSDADYASADVEISGLPVPKVRQYRYLGVPLSDTLQREEMVRQRRGKLAARVGSASQFLGNTLLPAWSRLAVLRAMIIPAYLYGVEIWGNHAGIVGSGSTIFNKAIRRLLGLGVNNKMLSIDAALLELNTVDLESEARARKARIFFKAPSMRTWIRQVARYPMHSRVQKQLLEATGRWVRTYGGPLRLTGAFDPATTAFKTSLRTTKRQFFEDAVDKRATPKPDNSTIRIYLKSDLKSTAKMRQNTGAGGNRSEQQAEWLTQHAKGFHLLMLARLRLLVTGRQRAQIGWAPASWMTRCPVCAQTGVMVMGETHSHLLVECMRWRAERARFLQDAIEIVRQVLYDDNGDARDAALPEMVGLPLAQPGEGLRIGGLVPFVRGPETWCASSQRRARTLLLGGSFAELAPRLTALTQRLGQHWRTQIINATAQFLQAIWPARCEVAFRNDPGFNDDPSNSGEESLAPVADQRNAVRQLFSNQAEASESQGRANQQLRGGWRTF